MISLIWISTLVWTHGTFQADDTRQIAHRWRPVIHPLADEDPNGPMALVDREKVRRYTRAMVALQHARQGRTPFGIVCDHDDAICLYVMHSLPNHKHVVHATLWWNRNDEDFVVLPRRNCGPGTIANSRASTSRCPRPWIFEIVHYF